MIYEIAVLPVYKEQIEAFRQAFAEVLPLLNRAQGYRGHVLAQEIETPELFNLIVRWRSLEDHTPGFEASEDHGVFMRVPSQTLTQFAKRHWSAHFMQPVC